MKDIDEILARYALELAESEELVAAGVQALESGQESPEVVELAGLTKPLYRRDVEPLFLKVIRRIGKAVPSKQDAATFLAKKIARRIVSGEIDPQRGLREIASLWNPGDRPNSLTPFYSLDDDLGEELVGLEQSSESLRKRKDEQIRIILSRVVEMAGTFVGTENAR